MAKTSVLYVRNKQLLNACLAFFVTIGGVQHSVGASCISFYRKEALTLEKALKQVIQPSPQLLNFHHQLLLNSGFNQIGRSSAYRKGEIMVALDSVGNPTFFKDMGLTNQFSEETFVAVGKSWTEMFGTEFTFVFANKAGDYSYDKISAAVTSGGTYHPKENPDAVTAHALQSIGKTTLDYQLLKAGFLIEDGSQNSLFSDPEIGIKLLLDNGYPTLYRRIEHFGITDILKISPIVNITKVSDRGIEITNGAVTFEIDASGYLNWNSRTMNVDLGSQVQAIINQTKPDGARALPLTKKSASTSTALVSSVDVRAKKIELKRSQLEAIQGPYAGPAYGPFLKRGADVFEIMRRDENKLRELGLTAEGVYKLLQFIHKVAGYSTRFTSKGEDYVVKSEIGNLYTVTKTRTRETFNFRVESIEHARDGFFGDPAAPTRIDLDKLKMMFQL